MEEGIVEEEYQALIKNPIKEEKTSSDFNEILPEESQEKELEKGTLTFRQILFLIFIGFFSFLTFFLISFPYNEVVKFYLNQLDKSRNLIIDFDELDFSLLGKVDLKKSVLSIGKGKTKKIINLDRLSLNLKPLKLYNNVFQGNLLMISPKMIISDILNLRFKTVAFSGNLNRFDKLQALALNQVNGNINLKIKSGSIAIFSELPFLGKLDEIKHKDTEIKFQFNRGKLLLKQFDVQTSIGKIRITGNILMESSLGNSILDVTVCPEFSQEFKESREDIDSMLLLFQNRTGDKCFPFGGTIAQPLPKFQLGF